MEVQCPQCQSRFHLPDAVVRPNVKLRCSVCQHVFRYADPASAAGAPAGGMPPSLSPDSSLANSLDGSSDDFNLDDAPSSSSKKEKGGKKKSKLLMGLIVILLCAAGGAGGWWYMQQQQAGDSASGGAPAATGEISKSVELMTMRNVRQYYVKNEKIGDIFVVEGKVVNEFPEPKELIEVEAALYAMDKSVLMSKKQLAGTALSLFQLQVLGEDELESFLHNEIEILTKNTNVPKGGEVPFMVLFYNPPAEVAEFGVKILSAKDVKKDE